MKKLRIMFITVFMVMVSGSAAWSMLVPKKTFSDLENRELQQMPKISAKAVLSGTFQKKYETYLSDQIFGRDHWVNGYAAMQYLEGKKEINGVYLGKDDYLIEKYEEETFDKALEKKNIRMLSEFLDTASEVFGKNRVSCLFVPSKAEVLEKKLPDHAKPYQGESLVQKIREQVQHKERVLDLKKMLLTHQEEYIYYRTDHHWTTLGAYYAYQEFQKLNGREAQTLDDYEQEVVFDDFFGTTYNKAHVRVKADEVRIFHTSSEKVSLDGNDGEFYSDSFYFKEAAKKSFDRYQLFFSKNTGKIVIKTGSKTGRTLLVIKDSFANCFIPFLANDYDEIIMVDPRYTKRKIGAVLKEYKEITDVCVLFNIEKFRQDTHLSVLKFQPERWEKEKESESEDDIFGDLIPLD